MHWASRKQPFGVQMGSSFISYPWWCAERVGDWGTGELLGRVDFHVERAARRLLLSQAAVSRSLRDCMFWVHGSGPAR